MSKKVSYVVEADIRSFFDTLDHEWLLKFLEHDIADKVRHEAVPESCFSQAA
jgi:retron-type reverse transcriptase